jgi:hypothetical protein
VDWIARKNVANDELVEELDLSKFVGSPSHIIIFDDDDDDGEITAIEMRGNGWLMDQDGDKHRFSLLGGKEYVDDKENKVRCEACKGVFTSKRALSSHQSKCRRPDEMTLKEKVKLRKTRELNAKRAGRKDIKVEQVTIKDASGNALTPVAKFTYLGTTVTTEIGSTKEINRRLGIAGSVMATLGKVWASSEITLRLKCELYEALVTTIVLYNGQCWLVNKFDMDKLEGFHFRCAKRITRKSRCPELKEQDVDKASRADVFKASGLISIEDMLRQKRLRWFGHLIRSKDGDPAKDTLMQQIKEVTQWGKQLLQDFGKKKITTNQALRRAQDRPAWRKLSSADIPRKRVRIRRPPSG